MKKSLKPLLNFFNKEKKIVAQHRVVIFIVAIVLIFIFIIYRISVLSTTKASDDQVNNAVKELKIVKLDPGAKAKIQQLKDLNIDIRTIFDPSRSNPFQ